MYVSFNIVLNIHFNDKNMKKRKCKMEL